MVNSFTILESGQRIEPIKRTGAENLALSPHVTTDMKETRNKVMTTGFLDLPAIEKWAKFYNVKEHHIKTLYRVLLRQSGGAPSTSTLEPDQYTDNCHPTPLLALDLHNKLLESDFPQKAASALFRDSADISSLNSKKHDESQPHFNINFVPCTSQVIKVQPSQSGGFKLVVQLQSGKMVETVIIRHDKSKISKKSDEKSHDDESSTQSRYTVCVSSQVGCARACTFCATGSMGLQGQLSSCEILEQAWHAQRLISSLKQSNNLSKEENKRTDLSLDFNENKIHYKKKQTMKNNQPLSDIRNVVYMGMGEPLDNYDAMIEACRGFTHQCLFGLKARQVTVSTVGATPSRIRWLAEDAPSISLALSLHGATRELREELIPSAKQIMKTVKTVGNENESASPIKRVNVDSLEELGEALDYHAKCTGKGAMIEYLLIDGVNDSDDAADALGKFCLERQTNLEIHQNSDSMKKGKSVSSFVNLIPYNPTLAGDDFGYGTPSDDRIDSFCFRLRENYGVRALVRWSSAGGRDTNGACGQLALSSSK